MDRAAREQPSVAEPSSAAATRGPLAGNVPLANAAVERLVERGGPLADGWLGDAGLVSSAGPVGSAGLAGAAGLVGGAGLVGAAGLVGGAGLVGIAGLVGNAGLVSNAAVRRLVEGDSEGGTESGGAAEFVVSRPSDPAERQAEAIAANRSAPVDVAGLARAAHPSGPSIVPGSAGSPLPDHLRAPAEAELGADLSGVRIHDDAGSHAFAKSVAARAATVGSHIYFGAGRFTPDSATGQRLLRHEIVHTLQPVDETALHRARGTALDRAPDHAPGAAPDHAPGIVLRRAPETDTPAAPDTAAAPVSDRVSAFKSLVTATAAQRLIANRQNLATWSALIQQAIPAADLAALGLAQSGGLQPFLDAQNMSDPDLRELRYQQAIGHYRACTGCHVEVSLYNTREERARAGGRGWVAPNTQRLASPMGFQPVPGTTEARLHELMPDPAEAKARTERMRAILAALGPAGYRVLPPSILEELEFGSEAGLRAQITAAIEERQQGYAALTAKITSGDLGYEHFGPIVRDLLPLADADVRAAIEHEMTVADRWRLAEAIVVGALSIAALVLALFPPTTAVGIAAFGALEMGLGVYGGVRGAQAIERGTAYEQGTGAHDVLDPAQQQAGGPMAIQGFINVVLAPLAVVAGALRAGTGLARVGAPATALLPAGQPYLRGAYIVTYAEDGAIVATLRNNPEVIIILRGNTLTVYQSMGPAGLRAVAAMEARTAWRAAGLPPAGSTGAAGEPLALPPAQSPLLLPPPGGGSTPGRFVMPLGPEGSGGVMFSNRPPAVNVLPTTGPLGGAPPAYSLPLGPQGAGGVMHMGRGLRPTDFVGLTRIADDAELLTMWNQALRESARPGLNNAYTRYLAAIQDGTVTTWSSRDLGEAFGVVNQRFLAAARGAGHDIATVHHWNYPKDMYWQQIVDPRQLVPVPGQAALRGGYHPLHQGGLHPLTTGVPGNPTGGPVAPVHELPLPVWMSTIQPGE
ncbi:DUF4157 domain-containing protein [Actinomycetes bacterium KLBMP 9797]